MFMGKKEEILLCLYNVIYYVRIDEWKKEI